MKPPSVCPVFFPRHRLSVSSPSAPALESNCPTTSDSRSCTDSLSGPFQKPQSTARRPLPLPGSLLLACTPPRPPTWKSQTVLPHSSAPPIAGWHIEFGSLNTTPLLHPVSRASPLLRAVPPLDSASVLSLSRFFRLSFFVNIGATGSHVPLNRLPTDSGHLNAGCRSVRKQVSPELIPRQRLSAVLTSSLRFRHFINGSLAVLFLPVT